MARTQKSRKATHRRQSRKDKGMLGEVKEKVGNTWEGVKDAFSE